MSSIERVARGTAVHCTDGPVGTVEGHARPSRAGETEDGVLLVRSLDGTRHYRVPSLLIRNVTVEDQQPMVLLQVPASTLEGYVAAVERPADSAAPSRAAVEEWAPQSAEEILRIPLVAEELTMQTQPISLGRVHVHKGVETLEQHLTIPVVHEEAIVERIAPEEYDASAPTGPDELIIPVMEEQIVFEKRTVVKEYIRIRKQRVQEEQEIGGSVRREFVEVTEQPRAHQDAHAPSLFTVQQ